METKDLILIICLLAFIMLVILLIILILNNNKNNQYINKSILEIRSVLSNNLLTFSKNLNSDFMDLSDRLNSNLIQSNKNSNEIFNNINERMVRIDEAQKGIDELSNEIVSLQTILNDKKNRGIFGEVELYSLLEAAYGNNLDKYQKQYKMPNGYIADAVIFGGETLGIFCIDSKFPLENYRRIYDEKLSIQDKQIARKQFKSDVKKHIDDIKNKYIIPGLTAELAYMFIPAEAIFAEIYANYSDLVEYSYKSKVYIVSPTTLMAYITAIKSIYLGHTKDENAKEIQLLLGELSNEFNRFYERCETLNKDYLKLQNDFEALNISSKKIIKKFNRINSGDIED